MRVAAGGRRPLGAAILLVIVVVVPTACVLWFMATAMRNERLAVRQRLTSAYRAQLRGIEAQLADHWREIEGALATGSGRRAAEHFAALVRDGLVDAAVVLGADGRPAYPRDPGASPSPPPAVPPGWREAETLEHATSDPLAAARAYDAIARRTSDESLAARALRARARCLAKAGQRDAATDILTEELAQPRFAGAVDHDGRLVAPDALLLALQWGDRSVLDPLRKRLRDYGNAMPAAQRRFLMRQVQELAPDAPPFETLPAEDLAAAYVASESRLPDSPGLRTTELPQVWQLASRDGRVVGLWIEDSLRALAGARGPIDEDIRLGLLPPRVDAASEEGFLALPMGKTMPGWRLVLFAAADELFDAAAEARITAYLWTGILVSLAIVVLALGAARLIGRQMRATRLKNDLIATVSHELKTPLASMRLLVDTLLDGRPHDARTTREYLEMIAAENARLSRLIEDFLAFSRMERNGQTFDRVEVAPAEVVDAAVAAMRGRGDDAARGSLEVDVAADLPVVRGDPEALSTVLVNLLDNAYKYTGDDKRIVLRAFRDGGRVCFRVEDNGIGMSRRAAKRVFDRFYQADRSLSRAGGGVGLGLSIVAFLVKAHGGEVGVDSRPGEGSAFSVWLPAGSET